MRREDLFPVQEEDESSVGLKSRDGDVCSGWQHGWALVEGRGRNEPKKATGGGTLMGWEGCFKVHSPSLSKPSTCKVYKSTRKIDSFIS